MRNNVQVFLTSYILCIFLPNVDGKISSLAYKYLKIFENIKMDSKV